MPTPAPDLDALLPRIAAGDAGAFGQYLSAVELTVRKSLKTFATRVDVEAALQETFLRVWQVAPRIVVDAQGNALLRVTLRIAKNLCISEVRRRREELPGDEAEPVEAATFVPPPDPLLSARLRACVDELPPQPAAALRARIASGGGEPDSALAEACRMKPNTFLQNVTRAKKLLVECLARVGIALPEVWT